jgi:hypothetical protein
MQKVWLSREIKMRKTFQKARYELAGIMQTICMILGILSVILIIIMVLGIKYTNGKMDYLDKKCLEINGTHHLVVTYADWYIEGYAPCPSGVCPYGWDLNCQMPNGQILTPKEYAPDFTLLKGLIIGNWL